MVVLHKLSVVSAYKRWDIIDFVDFSWIVNWIHCSHQAWDFLSILSMFLALWTFNLLRVLHGSFKWFCWISINFQCADCTGWVKEWFVLGYFDLCSHCIDRVWVTEGKEKVGPAEFILIICFISISLTLYECNYCSIWRAQFLVGFHKIRCGYPQRSLP